VKTFDFLEISPSPSISLYQKHILRRNVKALDAKGNEIPHAKPRLKQIKWVGFAPRVCREENRITRPKTQYLGSLDLFKSFSGDERYQAKAVI
jgi:hypothetical protein